LNFLVIARLFFGDEMKIPHASHPIWKLIRLALVGGILLALLHFNYKGLDARDATTILATLAALGGFDAAKGAATKRDEES
jgi:hypothetical protein